MLERNRLVPSGSKECHLTVMSGCDLFSRWQAELLNDRLMGNDDCPISMKSVYICSFRPALLDFWGVDSIPPLRRRKWILAAGDWTLAQSPSRVSIGYGFHG